MLIDIVNLESSDNPFEVKPSYKYWAPFIGTCTRSDIVYNTEHRKCRVTFNADKDGINSCDLTIDKLMEVFSEGKVCIASLLKCYLVYHFVGPLISICCNPKVRNHPFQTAVIKGLAREMGVSDKGSRQDTLRLIKQAMGVPEVFVKVFGKIHGGSGITKPHCLRQ